MIIAVKFSNLSNGKKKPEKIRASTGFEPVSFAILAKVFDLSRGRGNVIFVLVSRIICTQRAGRVG